MAIPSQKMVFAMLAVTSFLFPYPAIAAGCSDYIKAGENAYRQGNLVEAEKKLLSALKEAERSDANKLFAAEALTDLGVIYDETHRYDEAESAYKRSLAIREKAYGPVHMAVATTLNNMANLYKDQKRYKDAAPLYKRAIDICLQKEGSNSEFLFMSYYNLANLYQLENRHEEAIPVLKRSLQLSEQSPDAEEHQMDIIGKLGLSYDKLGKFKEAKPLFLRYFELAAKTLHMNPDDEKTVTFIKEFALIQRKENNTHVADLTDKAIEYRTKPPN